MNDHRNDGKTGHMIDGNGDENGDNGNHDWHHGEYKHGGRGEHAVTSAGDTVRSIIAIIAALALIAASGALGWVAHVMLEPDPVPETVTRTIMEKPLSENTAIRALADEVRLQDSSMSDVLTASIVGNAWGESGADPTALQKIDGVSMPDPADVSAVRAWAMDGRGIGIMQWGADRADGLLALAASEDNDWTSIEVQVSFLLSEVRVDGNWRSYADGQWGLDGAAQMGAWLMAVDVVTATRILEEGFVRPADPPASIDARCAAALAAYEYLQLESAGLADDAGILEDGTDVVINGDTGNAE